MFCWWGWRVIITVIIVFFFFYCMALVRVIMLIDFYDLGGILVFVFVMLFSAMSSQFVRGVNLV